MKFLLTAVTALALAVPAYAADGISVKNAPPPSEATKRGIISGATQRVDVEGGGGTNCKNLVVQNTYQSNTFGSWEERLQLYWCFNGGWVTYVYRSRQVMGGNWFAFMGWLDWQVGGCVNCSYVRAYSQGWWKRATPTWWDKNCYPIEEAYGYGTGQWSARSEDRC